MESVQQRPSSGLERALETFIGFLIIGIGVTFCLLCVLVARAASWLGRAIRSEWHKFLDEHWVGRNPTDLLLILFCFVLPAICFSLFGLSRAFAH